MFSIINNYHRKLFFRRLSMMTELCKELGVSWEAGEFGLKVGDKCFPLESVLDAEPYIRRLANKKAGRLDGWL